MPFSTSLFRSSHTLTQDSFFEFRDVEPNEYELILEANTLDKVDACLSHFYELFPDYSMRDFCHFDNPFDSPSNDDLRKYLDEEIPHAGSFCDESRRRESLYLAHELMTFAVNLRAFATSPNPCSIDELSKYVYSIETKTNRVLDGDFLFDTLRSFSDPDVDDPEMSTALIEATLPLKSRYEACACFRFAPCEYATFLQSGCASYAELLASNYEDECRGAIVSYEGSSFANGYSPLEDKMVVFILKAYADVDSEDPARLLASHLLETLCSINLHDIRPILLEGDVILQCESTMSSLWLALCQSFSKARAGKCAICGTPFLSHGERGKPRIYCDNTTCKKAAQRHPEKYADAVTQATERALKQLGRNLNSSC